MARSQVCGCAFLFLYT